MTSSRRSAVLRLLASGGPSDIPRLIVAVVVDTIDRILGRWAVADVCIKGFERFQPFIAHCYSSAFVVRKREACRQGDSCFHPSPCSVFSRICHAVCCRACSDYVFGEATARLLCASGKPICGGCHHVSAFTSADPLMLTGLDIGIGKDEKAPKHPTDEIGLFQATARLCIAACKRIRSNRHFLAAFAPAKPISDAAYARHRLQRGKSAEALFSQIAFSWHFISITHMQ